MLNTAIPILQMKISGILLSSIKNMIITIRSVNFSIVKGNADIEVDNDLISVFLTNEEADKISGGNYNISIIAENISGEDVSELVKVMWTKRGSMSKPVSGGSSDTDMSDYYTKHEVDALIQNIPSGKDGFSPTATVGKTGGVATITITDKSGTTTQQVFDGTDGFSPTITENPTNTENSYKLDITTKDGKFTTPNLKGGGENGTEVLDTVEEIEANTDAGKATGALVAKLILEMLGGFSFGYTEDGKPGFKEPNGDKFVAFSSGQTQEEMYKIATNIQSSYSPLIVSALKTEISVVPIVGQRIREETINVEAL